MNFAARRLECSFGYVEWLLRGERGHGGVVWFAGGDDQFGISSFY